MTCQCSVQYSERLYSTVCSYTEYDSICTVFTHVYGEIQYLIRYGAKGYEGFPLHQKGIIPNFSKIGLLYFTYFQCETEMILK